MLALVAAHRGLSTVVVEKAPHYGGSTARSGGGVWIPNNEVLKRRGVRDTPEAARTYLHGIVGEIVEPERIDAYLDRGPEMLSFVLKHTPLKMCWVPGYSDYYPEAPGAPADVDRAETVQRAQAWCRHGRAWSPRMARFRSMWL